MSHKNHRPLIEALEPRQMFAVSPIDPNLVGWYKLDEGAGSTTADASGVGNNGALANGPAWVAGHSGNALQFDPAATSRVSVADNSTLDITGPLTITAWVKTSLKDSQNIVHKGRYGSTDGYELGLSSNGHAFFRLNQKTSGDTYRVDSTSSYPTNNTWIYLSATFDGGAIKLYVNGAVQASKAAPISIINNSTALAIGSQDDGYRSIKGAVDDVRIYNRALSASEITALFQGTVTPPGNVAPAVNAGVDQTITLPTNVANLAGTVTDDGLPNPPASVSKLWSIVSAPSGGTVIFGTPTAASTTATFNIAGDYTLRLTANDGLLAATDDVIVHVLPAGQPGTKPSAPTSLVGKALSGSDVSLTWTDTASNETSFEVQRSASNTFSNPTTIAINAADVSAYTVTGLTKTTWYYFRVRAINSAGASAYTKSVKIKTLATVTPPTNAAPAVNAGPDQTLNLSAGVATLAGSATDDGLPNPPAKLTTAWSLVTAPAGGTITFGNAAVLNTTAEFNITGDYTLRLTASDGSLTKTDEIVLHVVADVNPLDAALDHALTFAQSQLNQTMTDLANNTSKFVNRTDHTTGKWNVVTASDWTSGFLAGSMWQLYNATGDSYWSGKAAGWTTPIAGQATAQTEDLYFRIMTTFLPLYQQTGNAAYKQVLLDAAASKNTQWNETIGAFETTWRKSSSGNPAANFGVLMDQTTDMILMLWAAQQTGNQTYYDRAIRHTRNVIAHLIRPDGSTYQFGYFDKATGNFVDGETSQGYANESTWSRGQAWGIYSLTTIARMTGLSDILAGAQKVANWYTSHLPADSVPFWDFDDPAKNLRDSSAAAIAASALLDLSTLVSSSTDKATYLTAATNALTSLSSTAYLAEGTNSHGILLHATGNHPNAPVGDDVSLIFGDYFFLEAINRYKALGL